MSTPQPVPTAPAYQAEFLRILNNRAKVVDESGELARDKGFVVITRGPTSLKRLQHLCEAQTYNHCLTARYRLLPKGSIGTLLAAFIIDLQKISAGDEGIAGGLIPASLAHWKELADSFYKNLERPTPRTRQGAEMLEWLTKPQGDVPIGDFRDLLAGFDDESVLRTGQRLVLFGELTEQSEDRGEWETALWMFPQLPQRVGIVLSGAPSDFKLPERNPHFLEISLSPADVDKPEQSVYRYTPSSFHKDEPASDDKLNVIDYADAIARFVLHEQTVPPLTIGIHGPWGKGKSSFMNLINSVLIKYAVNRQKGGVEKLRKLSTLEVKLLEAEIQAVERGDDKQAAKECQQLKDEKEAHWKKIEEAAKKDIISVSFNAWQFEDAKQTWAGLASQISAAIEKSLPWHSRQWLRLQYAWTERKTEMILQLLLPVAVICLVAGLFSLGFFRQILQGNPNDEVSTLLKLFLPAGSILLTVWFVSSQLLKVAEPISARVLSYVRLPNYREQMGFQHRVKDDLAVLYKFLKDRRRNCRVVVYIDDLDRCSEGKIMEILQAINLILASCKFFVFVGMDTEMIYRAIRSHYKDTPTGQSPERYLRKIVQVSFFLPPSEQDERMAYLYTLFSAKAQLERRQKLEKEKEKDEDKNVSKPAEPSGPPPEHSLPYNLAGRPGMISVEQKEAEDTPDELEAFEAYGGFLDDNPREIKRLINTHRLTKILLQKNTSSWKSEQQKKLVKWLIFCDRWPDLVDDLLAKVKDSRDSTNCLSDLALSLAKPIPELEEFAKRPEVLAAQDIDADFAKAAVLSQLVTKSPAAKVAKAAQAEKSVDTATSQPQAVEGTSPVESTSGPVA